METVMNLIQSLGFPIAVALGVGWFCKTVIIRVMDENREREQAMIKANADREERYSVLLQAHSEKMDDISRTLAAINYKIDSLTEEKN